MDKTENKIEKDLLEANETSKNVFEFLGVSEKLKIKLPTGTTGTTVTNK